jgi:hypothetical protein
MRVTLNKGIIRTCEECGFNHYERICQKCNKIYTTRNGDTTRYCSQRCGRLGKSSNNRPKL